jgi:hypothetical protein
MSETTTQHTKLDGIIDYADALDKLCKLAEHNLYLFEKNFDGIQLRSALFDIAEFSARQPCSSPVRAGARYALVVHGVSAHDDVAAPVRRQHVHLSDTEKSAEHHRTVLRRG